MEPEMKKCTWTINREDLRWHTGCGNESDFPDDSIKESGWEYCPFCSGEIVEGLEEVYE